MKFIALIALGSFVFLASKGRALDDDFSQDSCTSTLPMALDEPRDTPSLGSQSVSLGSLFDYLISNGRPGGDSPHIMGHSSDLLITTPRSSGSGKLKCTRGTTFYYKQPNESDSDLEPLGSQN